VIFGLDLIKDCVRYKFHFAELKYHYALLVLYVVGFVYTALWLDAVWKYFVLEENSWLLGDPVADRLRRDERRKLVAASSSHDSERTTLKKNQ
jgi:hypothetical protein